MKRKARAERRVSLSEAILRSYGEDSVKRGDAGSWGLRPCEVNQVIQVQNKYRPGETYRVVVVRYLDKMLPLVDVISLGSYYQANRDRRRRQDRRQRAA